MNLAVDLSLVLFISVWKIEKLKDANDVSSFALLSANAIKFLQILSRITLCASSFHSFIHSCSYSFILFFTNFLKGFGSLLLNEFHESLSNQVFIHSLMYLPISSFFFYQHLNKLNSVILFQYHMNVLYWLKKCQVSRYLFEDVKYENENSFRDLATLQKSTILQTSISGKGQ